MKQALTYSLKVWWTAVVCGPCLYLLLVVIINAGYSLSLAGMLLFILLSIGYGLVLSIPSYLALSLASYLISKRVKDVRLTKGLLTIVGIIATLLPFMLLFGHDDPVTYKTTIPWGLSYCAFVLLGIWFYKLQHQSTASGVQPNL